MTQPELDLSHGLPALVPNFVDKDSWRKEKAVLEVSKDLQNNLAKTELTQLSLRRGMKQRSKYSLRKSVHLHIWIKHQEEEKNSVLAQYAARHLDADDDRMAEYRKQFSAIVKHLHANGMLAFVPTSEQLENPKGFRWNQKAGCSCGCSPAFVAPSWLAIKSEFNEISATCEVKENEEVRMLVNEARLKSLMGKPVAEESVNPF
jgi:hypothetical protein